MKFKIIDGGLKKKRRTSSYIVNRDPSQNIVRVQIVDSYESNIDHLYKVANSLPLNEKAREELLWFIGKTKGLGKIYWVVRMINLYLQEYKYNMEKRENSA